MEPWTNGADGGRAGSFRALLRSWYGADAVESSAVDLADCRCRVGASRAVALDWLVLGAATPPLPVPSRLVPGRWVFRVRLCGEDCRRLGEALRAGEGGSEALLAALAVPSAGGLDWYAIDLRQAPGLGRGGAAASELEVPCANRLNAAVAGLLWGSRWFAEMTRLLRGGGLLAAAEPDELEALRWVCSCRPELLDPRSGADLPRLERLARRALERLRPRDCVGRINRRALEFLLSSAAYTIEVCRVVRGKGPVEGMRVYTGEPWGAESHTWLFARSFRTYLRGTARAVREPFSRYLRMFPDVPAWAGEGKARACALYHVMQSHRVRGARAALVEPLPDGHLRLSAYVELKGLGSERSRLFDLFGGTPYAVRSGSSLGRDVLADRQSRLRVATSMPLGGVTSAMSFDGPLAAELGLEADEVRLGGAPVGLLAPENEFLEYPRELWAEPIHAGIDPNNQGGYGNRQHERRLVSWDDDPLECSRCGGK